MAKPRVFISSTHYDLKYIRSSLEMFIDSLGYDAVLSEKGNIAYAPDVPLDESCYREVQNCDIYLLLIGGRYGAEASVTRGPVSKTFYERYESITKLEYKAAADKDLPIYILIERSVYAEYQTFRRNRDNTRINYAHVDSANIFYFVEEILNQPRNNPLQTFDRYSDIEAWLREQWAGLFRELLLRMSSQQQLTALSVQVAELSQLNETLKRYLEEVVTKVSPQEAPKIIASESERLEEVRALSLVRENRLVSYLEARGYPLEFIYEALLQATSIKHFFELLGKHHHSSALLLDSSQSALRDLDAARLALGLPPLLANNMPHSVDEEIVDDMVSGQTNVQANKNGSPKRSRRRTSSTDDSPTS